MNGFKESKLGELADFINGGAWSAAEYVSNGVPVIRVTDIKSETVDLSDCKFLPTSAIRKYRKHLLEADDLVICTVGSHPTQPGSVVGRTVIIPQSAHGSLLNQNAVRIRASSATVDQRWLGYLGRSQKFHDYIVSCARGSANQVRMAIGLLKEMPIDVPPLSVQRRIASILTAYDDLIENNMRRIAILEEMARRIFEEWFVHFRAPGCEGLALIDSPLGPIPQGWDVLPTTQAFRISYGKTLPKINMTEEGEYPVYGAGSVIGRYDKHNIDGPAALITSRGAGSGAVSRAAEAAFVTNNSFIVLPGRRTPDWSHPIIQFTLERSAIKNAVGGSAQPQLTLDGLCSVLVPLPPSRSVQSFCAVANPMIELSILLDRANANLRAQRDLLLPKLISGEIDVSAMPSPLKEAAE